MPEPDRFLWWLVRRLHPGGPGAMSWRLNRLARWVAADLGSAAIQLCARSRALRWVPRRWLIPAERALIGFRGAGLFDPAYYLAQNPDVRDAAQDPFRHYLRHGWREGRAPNARFDDAYYRASAGLSRAVPVSPLAHFLAFGRRAGFCPMPGVDLDSYRDRQPMLSVARIDAYRHLVGTSDGASDGRPDLDQVLLRLDGLRPPAGPAEVDVVVPVYAGRAETLNTLCHVLDAKCRTRFSVVVVDDATPDALLAEDLRRLAADGLIRLIRNDVNRGFVASVNTGSACSPDRDVIWLNADTEVYDGWIDRLRAAAVSRPNVASVTPLTNNGTICSYPRFNADNPGTLELDWPRLDRLAARFNRGVRVEAPTGVGFAMYVRRAALRALGPLDLRAFGRGYGEENDFCQRAIARGWVNLIAADTIVRHFGATSFRDSRADRVEAALKVLDRRYPGYRASVGAFVAADPLARHRRALDLARLGRLSRARNVLLVTHRRGGGTEQHVRAEVARLEAQGCSVFLLTEGTGSGHVSLGHASAPTLPSLQSIALGDDWLWRSLAILRIGIVHIHHLIGMGTHAPAVLRDRLARAGLPYHFAVHDYFAVCPRINMVDLAGRYCGEPDQNGCQSCLGLRGGPAGRVDIATWRQRYGHLLADARSVIVPDRDVARRLGRYYPGLRNVLVRPHEASVVPPAGALPERRPGPVRIAVIGAIGPVKGYDSVLGLASYLRARPGSGELTVIGYSRDDAALRAAGAAVSGPYLNDEVTGLIQGVDPDLIWIPSLWPETYCYTLSIALRSGRPVAAFAIGALATRLEGVGRGTLLPLDLADRPAQLWPALRGAARPEQDRPLEAAS